MIKDVGLYALGNTKMSKLIIDKRIELMNYLEMWLKNKYKDIPNSDLELIDRLNKYNKPGNKYSNKLKELYITYILHILGADRVTSILLSMFINIVSSKDNDIANNQTNIYIKVGRTLFDNVLKVLYDEYKTKHKHAKTLEDNLSFNGWVLNKTNDPVVNMFNTDNLNINTYTISCGSVLMGILAEKDLIVPRLVSMDSEGKTMQYIGIDASVSDLLRDSVSKVRALPLHLPMVEVPKEHNVNVLGGYLLNGIEYRESLIIINPHLKLLQSSKIDKDNLYKIINDISSTPFTVNTVFSAGGARDYINKYGYVNSLLLNNPVVVRSKEAKKQYIFSLAS